jgi:hypothetical protein
LVHHEGVISVLSNLQLVLAGDFCSWRVIGQRKTERVDRVDLCDVQQRVVDRETCDISTESHCHLRDRVRCANSWMGYIVRFGGSPIQHTIDEDRGSVAVVDKSKVCPPREFLTQSYDCCGS